MSFFDTAARAKAYLCEHGRVSLRALSRGYVVVRAFLWQARLHEILRVVDTITEIGGGDAGADIEVLGWRPYVEALSIRANAHLLLGRLHAALEFAERLPVRLSRPGLRADMSSSVADRTWTYWVLGDVERGRHASSEGLQAAERFGADRNVVYALLACGIASCLALRWQDGDGFLERARQRISATGAGREWTMFIDGLQALCWAGMGDHERSLALARRGVEQARANALDLPRIQQGALAARVLRMVGGLQHQRELEAQIAETLELIQRTDAKCWLPFVLLERAGLARLRGDADGMARDLAEARRLFA